jgi:hypothetical protein
MDTIRLGDSDKMRIIMGGINDTADTVNVDSPVQLFPVIVVIDPEKVIGNKRSVSASGFHLPESDAEVYYIRLPLSDMEYARKVEASVISILTQQQNTIPVCVESGPLGELPTQFEYVFDRTMVIREVKTTNMTETAHARLVAEGKITCKLDKVYLENLKNGVRYWDGREWRMEAVRVNHLLSLSMRK